MKALEISFDLMNLLFSVVSMLIAFVQLVLTVFLGLIIMSIIAMAILGFLGLIFGGVAAAGFLIA